MPKGSKKKRVFEDDDSSSEEEVVLQVNREFAKQHTDVEHKRAEDKSMYLFVSCQHVLSSSCAGE